MNLAAELSDGYSHIAVPERPLTLADVAWVKGGALGAPEQLPHPPKRIPRVRSLCQKPVTGYLHHPDKKTLIPTGCMAWSCKACARVLAYRVRHRLEKYHWTAKLELTLDGDGEPTRENNLRLAQGQRSLLQFVRRFFRRRYGKGFTLRYARMHGVGERGGRLHSHMVWDAPYLPQDTLSEHAEACGLGFRVYIRAVHDRRGSQDKAAQYVADQAAKYVAGQAVGVEGQPDLPPRSRRFQSSGVAKYEPSPGWSLHRICPYGLPCEFCGDCPEPEFIRLERVQWLQHWALNLATGELTPTFFGAAALSSLVNTGETASPEPAETEELRQFDLFDPG